MTDTKITQADRIAWADYEDFGGASRARALSGAWDATSGLHFFAKHRLAARNEALAEAAKEIVAYCREMNAAGQEASFFDAHRRVLALTASQGGDEG